MGIRDGRLDRAISAWRSAEARLIDDLRMARLGSGLGREELGREIHLSADRIGRFERRELEDVGLGFIWRYAAGVGLVPSVRLYPADDPLRDTGHVRLLERFRVRLPPQAILRSEVPLPGWESRRAWDADVTTATCRDGVEAETRLTDLQAVMRRLGLKRRDDPTIRHVFLLVADTRANRDALALGRELLRADFPLDTRAALARLTEGSCPGAGAVIVL